MSKAKTKRPFNLDDLLTEANMACSIMLVAIAKEVQERTGELSGSFPCPRCNCGTVKWSVAPSNKHARVICTRQYMDADGTPHPCTHAIE